MSTSGIPCWDSLLLLASFKMQCLKYALLIVSLISSMIIVPLNSDANVTNANVTNANVTNASVNTKTNGSSVAPRCLRSLHSLYEEFASTVPPLEHSFWGNYQNISRALFPLVNLPSLYVEVTIQFLKDFENGTRKINDELLSKNLTWSAASCFVVSSKFTSLDALSFYSLATILPRRRSENLTITVPPFCSESRQNDNELWKYAVLTLQDIAINANVSDPSLNTARCVVIGHEENSEQEIILDTRYDILPWLVLGSSVLASIVLLCFMHPLIKGEWKEITTSEVGAQKTILKNRILIGTILNFVSSINILLGIYGIVVSLYFSFKEKHVYSILYLFFLVVGYVFSGLVFFFNCCKLALECYMANDCDWKCTKNKLAFSLLLPCIFQVFHYLLWVVCGIISEPPWAISIFLLESLAMFFLVFAIYLYQRDVVMAVKPLEDGKDWIIAHLVCAVVVCWFILSIIGLVGYGGIPDIPLAGIIETCLTITLMWLVKNSGLKLKEKKKRRTNELLMTGIAQ